VVDAVEVAAVSVAALVDFLVAVAALVVAELPAAGSGITAKYAKTQNKDLWNLYEKQVE